MTYHDQAATQRDLAQGSSRGLLAGLALVLGTLFFIAFFGNGGNYNPDDTRDLLSQQDARAPQQMPDWRGNSAHIPAAE